MEEWVSFCNALVYALELLVLFQAQSYALPIECIANILSVATAGNFKLLLSPIVIPRLPFAITRSIQIENFLLALAILFIAFQSQQR
jgi:hypothetical protein